ncbi:MAG: rhodanese-related sulfurtransferase [Proteobacteria bacterium]|nr:rhodanese-related sulfurtransferase [Pseudomonadota bacterium]MBS0573072.1 rhodanese-related sulfurtransferase [Pseudomonadota bacterium]
MIIVTALYRFTRFDDPAALRGPLLAVCAAHQVRGTLLLAPEGINGTIAGTRAGIDAVLAHIRTLPGCAAIEWKESPADTAPFGRMKVRLKREIVTMGQPQVDPAARTGAYIAPADWNALIRAPDVAVIDTRNDYEVGIGSFAGAVNPGICTFRDFPAWWRAHADEYAGKRIAMFCTGGIRCEKSTNFLIGEGVREVFHLQGGILKYLEETPREQSLWQGACFVFDQRVSVTHGLAAGNHALCHACRRPLAPADRLRPEYEEGARCHQCADTYSEARREGFRERHRQMRGR